MTNELARLRERATSLLQTYDIAMASQSEHSGRLAVIGNYGEIALNYLRALAASPLDEQSGGEPVARISLDVLKWWRELVDLNPADLAPRLDQRIAELERAAPPAPSEAEKPETKGPYEARICKGIPSDCCDYGVVSLSEGREVCRVWREQDARAVAAALRGSASPPEAEKLKKALQPLLKQWDEYLASDLNYLNAHQLLVRYELWNAARAALGDAS